MSHQTVDIEADGNSHYSQPDSGSPGPESAPLQLWQESILEMVGTAFFVYISLAGVHQAVLGSIASGSTVDQIHISICFTLGLSTGIVLALKSGAHLNSSVSFTLWLDGQITLQKFVCYVFAQLVGGFLGALLVIVLYHSRINRYSESNALIGSFGTLKDPTNSLFASILDQIIGSALLMFGIMKAPDTKFKPLVIGLVLGGLGLFQGSNGFAFNLARDLAPRIASTIIYGSNAFTAESYWFWVPMCMPFIGMPIGYSLSKLIR
jgi:MIP family channel proteins